MNVRRAIELLQKLPPDAELMIDAPFECSKTTVIAKSSHLLLPVRSLTTGSLYHPHPPGAKWVCFNGTDAWGVDQGIEK